MLFWGFDVKSHFKTLTNITHDSHGKYLKWFNIILEGVRNIFLHIDDGGGRLLILNTARKLLDMSETDCLVITYHYSSSC